MESGHTSCAKFVHGTSLEPNPQPAPFPNGQRQWTPPSSRPRNSDQAQSGSAHGSHPRARRFRNQYRAGANENRRETQQGSNHGRNKDDRTNGAPGPGSNNLSKDLSLAGASHTNGNMQRAGQVTASSDRIKSQINAVLQANDQPRPIPVPSDHYTGPSQATIGNGGGKACVPNSFDRKCGGRQNNRWRNLANETTKAQSQNQKEEYEQGKANLNKLQNNQIGEDKSALEQTSLPNESSESKPSLAVAASSLPDQPRGPNKSYCSGNDQSINHHQQIEAALNSSNQQTNSRFEAQVTSAIQDCNMKDKQLVHHETPRASKELHKSQGLRGHRLGDDKGSQRASSCWSRGLSSAAGSYEESFGKGSTFDQSDLDPVVNDNSYRRINLGKLPKYHCPGSKRITDNRPVRRMSNAPSHHGGRNAFQESKLAQKDSVPVTGRKNSTDRFLAQGNASKVAHQDAASDSCNAACTDNPTPAESQVAHQCAFQHANEKASQVSPHHTTNDHVNGEHHQAVHCRPDHQSQATRLTAAPLSLQTEVSTCDKRREGDKPTQSLDSTVLPPHLRNKAAQKATVAVPNIFSSTTEANKTRIPNAHDFSEDRTSKGETREPQNLGHGFENIVSSNAPIPKANNHHGLVASTSPDTALCLVGQASFPADNSLRDGINGADWGGAWQDPPIGNDWNMRPQHPIEERKAVTHAFAEEQAVDPELAMPVVNMHSPGFLSGQPVLDDEGVHELNLNDTRPRLKARPNGHASKSSKTAEDRVKEHAVRVANLDVLQPTPMTAEEKREIRRMVVREYRNRPSPPNLHAPVANIYLRPVETKDVRQITDLWNHFVTSSTDVPQTQIDETVFWHNEITRVIADHEPFLVAIIKGDNSSRSFREARRLRQEHVVGFARATDYGTANSVYQYTVELEVYVQDGHMRKGIGTCLFDRMMNALSPRYDAKNGVPLICNPKGGELSWTGGAFRSVKTILINLLGQENDEAVAWKKTWLEKEDFHQCGYVPGIGFKQGKLLHETKFYYDTGMNL